MMSSTTVLAAGARVHLIGIGGAGMSPLAWILLERGHRVSGSDLRGGHAATALLARGADVRVGHDAWAVDGADVVAVSTAIPATNPEVIRARELGLPVLRRAELLASLLDGYRGILIAGTHGKTTTTSMTAVCLSAAGLDPSFAIGGALHGAGVSARHGKGDLFVAEADESDSSFLVFRPDCAVVTNVELDHPDEFPDLDAVCDVFRAFLRNRRSGDAPAICCLDDPVAADLAAETHGRVETYGEHPAATLRIIDPAYEADGTRFSLRWDGEDLGAFRIRLPGRHNVANAAAAAAASLWAGAAPEDIRAGLSAFSGTQRRFELIGRVAGVTVVDDYAHHPTEVSATIAAARQTGPVGRVVAVFQPHRFSRTAVLGVALGEALAAADVVVVTDVYGAGEAAVPGVTGVVVADAARAKGVETHYVPAIGEVGDRVAGLARPDDLVLTLGAGDITGIGRVVLRRLEDIHG